MMGFGLCVVCQGPQHTPLSSTTSHKKCTVPKKAADKHHYCHMKLLCGGFKRANIFTRMIGEDETILTAFKWVAPMKSMNRHFHLWVSVCVGGGWVRLFVHIIRIQTPLLNFIERVPIPFFGVGFDRCNIQAILQSYRTWTRKKPNLRRC